MPRWPLGLRAFLGDERGLRVRDRTATAGTERTGCSPPSPCPSAGVTAWAKAWAAWAGRLDTRSGMGIGAVGDVGDGGTELSASEDDDSSEESSRSTSSSVTWRRSWRDGLRMVTFPRPALSAATESPVTWPRWARIRARTTKRSPRRRSRSCRSSALSLHLGSWNGMAMAELWSSSHDQEGVEDWPPKKYLEGKR